MKLDVYALKQSTKDISFISPQHKQGRKYDALASSPLLTCQLFNSRLELLFGKALDYICTGEYQTEVDPYPQHNGERK